MKTGPALCVCGHYMSRYKDRWETEQEETELAELEDHKAGICPGAPACGYCLDDFERSEPRGEWIVKMSKNIRRILLTQFKQGDDMEYLAKLYGFTTERIEQVVREALIEKMAQEQKGICDEGITSISK